MNDYIVLENIPNTPEGRAFLKQLRKYLRPQYRMRSRGRNKDRKGVAERLVRDGIVKNERPIEIPDLTDADLVRMTHTSLRQGMSCKYADRITTTIDARNEGGILFLSRATEKRKRGFYLYPYTDAEQGPFRTWEAARAARTVTKGI